MVPTESKNESPLRVALSKMHLLIKSSLDKDRICNKHNARTEGLALWHTAHNSVRCFGDVNWGLGGLPQILSELGLKAVRVHGVVLCLFMSPVMLKGMGHLGIHGTRLNWVLESHGGRGGGLEMCQSSSCTIDTCELYIINTHTQMGRRKQIFVSSDSRNIPFG